MSKFTYRKRVFLNPISTGVTSYIFAEVECSNHGRYNNGTYMLTLADCRRSIEFEFFLGTAVKRKQSLAKIDLLIKVLTGFREALKIEAQHLSLYNRRRSKVKRKFKGGKNE